MSRTHEFPTHPVPAVGAIVFRGDAVLLVKRASEPHAGRWSLPGGRLEAGETVEAAVVREVAEETGLAVRPLGVSNVTDYVERAADGRVRWHYVLIDLLCEPGPGEPRPATDASDARFVPLQELAHHDVIRSAVAAIEAAARTRSP